MPSIDEYELLCQVLAEDSRWLTHFHSSVFNLHSVSQQVSDSEITNLTSLNRNSLDRTSTFHKVMKKSRVDCDKPSSNSRNSMDDAELSPRPGLSSPLHSVRARQETAFKKTYHIKSHKSIPRPFDGIISINMLLN